MKVLKFTILILIFTLTSCGARKTVVIPGQGTEVKASGEASQAEFKRSKVIEHAMQFLGTKYKYFGTNSTGMDCSGLIYTAFLQEKIPLPRTSRDMALLGEKLDLEQVKTGDLLFFETDKNKRIINHVGLVVELEDDKIFFIHSSTSRGVIVSALHENYWRNHFVMARRIL